eukprot:scaffold2118_cov120-Skeletonema_marinoi.AAC.11
MKNSRLELRAISEFNFMLRYHLYDSWIFLQTAKREVSRRKKIGWEMRGEEPDAATWRDN